MENTYDIQDLLQLDEADSDDEDNAAPEQEAETLEYKLNEAQVDTRLKLDYKLKTCEERADLVAKIVEQTPKENLTDRYLEILGDYIMGAITKEEKKAHMYLTDNRRITIDRRETSFEGLAEKFENGEDGIYNLISDNKNILFSHKQEITKEDIETVPGLKELREAIAQVEESCKTAVGRNKYLLKKQLIEMRKDQYVLKNCFKAPMYTSGCGKGSSKIDLSEERYVNENGEPQSTGLINLFNPEHVAAVLSVYSQLKFEMKGKFQNDFYYFMEDFDKLMKKSLQDYPMYRDIVKMRINGASNNEVQEMVKKKYNESHSIQYVSMLWRTRIPKIISDTAKEEFLIWHYEVEQQGPMKKCSCCKRLKPANSRFFSKNSTSKDGFYSLCKACRKARNEASKANKK